MQQQALQWQDGKLIGEKLPSLTRKARFKGTNEKPRGLTGFGFNLVA